MGVIGMDFKHNPRLQLITVSISDDKMTAHLTLASGEGIRAYTVTELRDLLSAHGVGYGILDEPLASFAANPTDYVQRPVLIAQGVAPQSGTDGYIRYLFQMDSDATKPNVLDDGRVDFKDVKRINNVQQGQVIAEKVSSSPGIPGKTVTGEEVPPPKPKEAYFKPGKNVVLDDERVRMYAVLDGMVTFTDQDRVNVFPVYEVNGDVDYRSGNIDFVGNVVVRGNIITGFTVKAAGDIRITGSVEGAEIIASGSIDIAGGIVGHNKGFVRSGRTIRCSFIQDANVEAGEDLIVNQSIMHSNVKAGKSIVCNGAKGLIVGGVVQAGESVTARTIGNPSFTPTSIEVGISPEMRNELNQHYANMNNWSDNLDKSDKALRLLEQMAQAAPLSEDKKQLLDKLRHTKQQILEQQAVTSERIEELERILENIESAKIEVIGIIYGGSKVVIGRYTRYIKDAAQRVGFRYDDGEVMMYVKN